MSLNEAFFVSAKLHERTVTLPDGSTHTLHFRELTAVEWVRYRDMQRSEDENTRAVATARMIALSLCEPDGKPAITNDQAMKLKPGAMAALFEKVLEVNTFDAKKPSPSEGSGGSATS